MSVEAVSSSAVSAAVSAEDDLAVGDVMNNAWLDAIKADKAHAAKDRPAWKQGCQPDLIAQPILERQQDGLFADHWRQQFGEAVVRRRLERDNHEVARPNLSRRTGGLGANMKIAVRAPNMHAIVANSVVI